MKVGRTDYEKVYGYCVGVLGIDPVYFLDEMSIDEINSICEARNDIDQGKFSFEKR
jgi:hypothetical protein